MLRLEATRQRLLALEEVLSNLEQLQGLQEHDLRANWRDAWAVEWGLQLGAGLILAVGNHILSAHFGTPPQDYGDIIHQLEAHGVIDRELHDRLEGLAGFRDIVVHDYLRIDPHHVAAALHRAPADFNDFAAALRRWLEENLS